MAGSELREVPNEYHFSWTDLMTFCRLYWWKLKPSSQPGILPRKQTHFFNSSERCTEISCNKNNKSLRTGSLPFTRVILAVLEINFYCQWYIPTRGFRRNGDSNHWEDRSFYVCIRYTSEIHILYMYYTYTTYSISFRRASSTVSHLRELPFLFTFHCRDLLERVFTPKGDWKGEFISLLKQTLYIHTYKDIVSRSWSSSKLTHEYACRWQSMLLGLLALFDPFSVANLPSAPSDIFHCEGTVTQNGATCILHATIIPAEGAAWFANRWLRPVAGQIT